MFWDILNENYLNIENLPVEIVTGSDKSPVQAQSQVQSQIQEEPQEEIQEAALIKKKIWFWGREKSWRFH